MERQRVTSQMLGTKGSRLDTYHPSDQFPNNVHEGGGTKRVSGSRLCRVGKASDGRGFEVAEDTLVRNPVSALPPTGFVQNYARVFSRLAPRLTLPSTRARPTPQRGARCD
ncbi:hypothetical protein KM043_006408 [Ampulex compressa]|nr:hypothetical protein KM043_006408 [Ampulex compressa]